jgi:hypothetical protein
MMARVDGADPNGRSNSAVKSLSARASALLPSRPEVTGRFKILERLAAGKAATSVQFNLDQSSIQIQAAVPKR